MPRSLDELLARMDEEDADRAESFEPTDRGVDIDQAAAAQLRAAARNRYQAERDLMSAVAAARATGMPWSSIGIFLGTTGEAARQRYGKAKRKSA